MEGLTIRPSSCMKKLLKLNELLNTITYFLLRFSIIIKILSRRRWRCPVDDVVLTLVPASRQPRARGQVGAARPHRDQQHQPALRQQRQHPVRHPRER